MTEEKIRQFMENTARSRGWRLTPDGEQIGYLLEGFAVNVNRYGYLQCPCREGSGSRERDKDILCPCDYSAPDIAEYGQCYCGLYLNEETFRRGGAQGSIPERRPEEKYRED